MDTNGALHFESRVAWRRWLEKNSGDAQEVWLIHYKKHSGKISIGHADAVEEALCFGWIDGKMKSVDEEMFILRYSPRRTRSIWSKINKERAEKMVTQGRMTTAGLIKIEEAKLNGSWDGAYSNKTRDGIPIDLDKALLEDLTAWHYFARFANSYRNMHIGWVCGAKTEGTRKQRIAEVVKRSALNKKLGIE